MKTLMLAAILALAAGFVVNARIAEAGWVAKCGYYYDYCYAYGFGYCNGSYGQCYTYGYHRCYECPYVWE